MRADMHTHTVYSDGLLTPSDIVERAKFGGLGMVVITDHDNALAYNKFKNLAKNAGLKSCSGIEISAYDGSVKVHTLGYGFQIHHPLFEAYQKRSYDTSLERTFEIISKLKKNGMGLTIDEIMREKYCKEGPIHTMHIARAAARKGYANSPVRFYLDYLNVGKVGFTTKGRLTPYEATELITACGGVAVLAHPGRIVLEQKQKLALIDGMIECGLKGIEAIYSAHTEEETEYYKEIATGKGLLITGGSDTHIDGGNRTIGTPHFEPSLDLLQAIGI